MESEVVKICLKCGLHQYGNSNEDKECYLCGSIMKNTEYNSEVLDKLIHDKVVTTEELRETLKSKYKYDSEEYNLNMYSSLKITKWADELCEKYVLNSPEFDEELFLKREKDEYDFWLKEERESRAVTASQERYQGQVENGEICPNCGGTQFTPVRKKWSILTGFMTNKVELICNQCGTKIK